MNDRYHIISTLASGGGGSIQHAWDKSQNRDVAIKRLHAEGLYKDHLVREARSLYALRHPNVVTIHEYGSDEQGAFLVMELIKGETLDHRLTHGPLNIADFKTLVNQTLAGISAAHEAGLIHRDLKPENIMLPWHRDGHFEVKLIDFGLAQPLPTAGGPQDSMAGSVHFMAPEQFGSGHVDVRTDLYALGCIYYQALTGSMAFPGELKAQVITAHLYPPRVPLAELRPDLNDELCQWVNALMSVQPAGRPRSAADATAAFRRFSGHLVVQSASAVEPEPALMVLEEDEVPAVLMDEDSDPVVEVVQEYDAEPEFEPQPDMEPELQIQPEPAPEFVETPVFAEAPAPAGPQHHETTTRHRMPAAAPAQPRGKRRSSLHLIIAAFAAIIVLQFAIVSYFKYAGREGREQRLAELSASEQPQGSDVDVRTVLDFLEATATRVQAAEVLAKLTGGDYINEIIVERLQDMKDRPVAASLVTLVGQRRAPGAFATVLELTGDGRREVRLAAWRALGRITPAQELPKVLDAARRSQKTDHEMIEDVLVSAIETAEDRPVATGHASKAYQSAADKPEVRALLFNVLTRVGGDGVVDLVKEAIADPAQKVRLAAIRVLARYPTHEPLLSITTRLPQETDPTCRIFLLLAARELVSKPGPSSQQNLFVHAQNMFANANGSEEKSYVLNVMSRIISPSTATFFENFSDPDDQDLTQEARDLAEVFRDRLTRVTTVSPDGAATPAPAANADYRPDGTLSLDEGALINWTQRDDWASWLVELPRNGEYEIAVYQSSDNDEAGTYEVLLAGQTLLTAVVKTKDDADFKGFVAGKISVPQAGIYRLQVRPKTMPVSGDLFRVQRLTIKAL